MANKSKMISVRLAPGTAAAIQARAAKGRTTQSKALTALIDDALSMRGRDGLETRIAALEATVAEQERIIQRAGKRTPRVKRLSVGMTLAEAAQVEKAAHKAGMTRAEFLRSRIFAGPTKQRTLSSNTPALPAAA